MVLLSAAVVFAGLGWLGLSDSDDSGSSAVATTTAPAPTTVAPAAPASPTSAPASPPPASASPTTTTASPTTSSISAAAVMLVPVRVYNNSTIEGLANTTASKLRGEGWNVTDVRNYDSGQIPQSTVFYSPAAGEKEAAEKLAQSLGFVAEPRFEGIVNAPPGVIVILAGNGGN